MFHKVCSILVAVLLGYLIICEDVLIRMLLSVLILVLFYTTLISFSVKMEKQQRKNWDSKKDKLIKEMYSEIISPHYKRKTE